MHPSTNHHLYESLKKSILFRVLPDAKLIDLLPMLKPIHLNAGDILFKKGDSPDYVYIVEQGRLSVFFIVKNMAKVIGTVNAHETLGELGALSGEVRSLSAKAEVETDVIGITSQIFKELCKEYPAILLDFLQPLIARSLNITKMYEENESAKEYALSESPENITLTLEENNLIEHLKQAKLFVDVPDVYLIKLLPYLKYVKLISGNILFQQGDPSDYIYVIISGKLSAYLVTIEDEHRTIGIIEPGETVGDLGVLSHFSRSLTVRAIEDAELIGLPKEIFRKMCQDFSFVLQKVVDPIINRSVQTIKLLIGEKHIENIIFFSAENTNKFSLFKINFEHFIKNKQETKLIDSNKDINYYTECEKNSRKDGTKNHLFFIEKAEDALFDFVSDRIGKLYLVVDPSQIYTDMAITRMIQKITDSTKIKIYLVLLHSDDTRMPVHTMGWLKTYNFVLHHHLRIGCTDDYARLYRFASGTAIGLVLGGGGARGIAHVGVIKALKEKNIIIDAIGGTSIGAMVGACYLLEDSYDKFINKLFILIESCYQSLSLKNFVWPVISLLSGDPATKTNQQLFGDLLIEDLWLPFFCISSNLSTHQEVVHRNGLVSHALRSSSSIPGVLPPVVINGHLHLDGGLLNNLPVDVMREIVGSSGTVIAVKLSSPSINPTNYFFPDTLTLGETILTKLGLTKKYRFPYYLDTFFNSLLLGANYKEQLHSLSANLLINPDLSKFKTFGVLRKYHNLLIDLGYSETIRVVEKS